MPTDGYATLVKKNLGYLCRVAESANCLDCYYAEAVVWAPIQVAISETITPTAGAWDHLACVYDGTTVTLYWDAIALGSVVGGAGAIADTTEDFGIGEDPDLAGENLVGSVDDVKLWTSARTPARSLRRLGRPAAIEPPLQNVMATVSLSPAPRSVPGLAWTYCTRAGDRHAARRRSQRAWAMKLPVGTALLPAV